MSKPWEKIKRIKELLEDIESEFDAEECNHDKTVRDLIFFRDENIKLQNQLKEANAILNLFSGRDGYEKVNDYFSKYMNKSGEK